MILSQPHQRAVAIWSLLTVMVDDHSVLAQSSPQPGYDCTTTLKEAETLRRNKQMTIARTEQSVIFTFPSGRYIFGYRPAGPVPPGFPSALLPPLSPPYLGSGKLVGVIPNDVDLESLRSLAFAAITESCAGVIGR
jgi:hypothetical protein